jgi:hypothetical protein
MAYAVSGSPLGPFADAVLTALTEDSALTAIVGDRIVATLKTGTTTPLPYIVGGRRDLMPGAVAMQLEGGRCSVWLDFWSEQNDPGEVQQMMARARVVLSRDRTLAVQGFTMFGGSLECEEDLVIPDFDPDMPQKSLYHGVQKWSADVEEKN